MLVEFFFASTVAVINLYAIVRYIKDSNILKAIFHKISCLPTNLLQVKRKGVREKRREPELIQDASRSSKRFDAKFGSACI